MCFQLETEWCSTSQGIGRCRPDFNCFNENKLDNSNCSKTEHVCCPEPEIPALMCRKYAKSVFSGGGEMARSLSNSSSSQTSVCASSHTPLIVGGEKASDKEFPYMAVLGYGKTFETAVWICGAALISDKFLLSAAHCLKSDQGFVRWARLGNVKLKEKSPNEQIFQITKKLVHPKYKLPSFMYDIMLLELDKPVTLTPYVRPACLNMNDTVNTDTAIATGFGKLEYTSDKGTNELMKVSIDINPLDVCQKTYSYSKRQFPVGVHDSVLCAGVLKGGKDTCQGDSGGPLVVAVDEPFCMYCIIGVTSFGLFCGFANSPAIYTRVSYFTPWIVENVWKKTLKDQNGTKPDQLFGEEEKVKDGEESKQLSKNKRENGSEDESEQSLDDGSESGRKSVDKEEDERDRNFQKPIDEKEQNLILRYNGIGGKTRPKLVR
uniref:Seminal fluid protein n=1 Tax=Nilaparvata lugens TaxID=108931 RepID=A0A1I9WL60_NILLU|nr:seminal fluid protein [Nilaparvata lugens]